LLDVTDWKQEDARVIHLVNLTNPMTMRGSYHELIPLGEQSVRVRLEEGRQPERVRLLKAEHACSFAWNPPDVSLQVPEVLDHEVVVIELA
jgi:hypothetical protein